MPAPILHGYFRSTASYRVRIVLNLKGVDYAQVSHHLRKNEQLAPDFMAINPQGLVPALDTGGRILTQSLAICEYLDETYPRPPLLPSDPLARAQVRSAAQLIACEIHPLQNLRVLGRLRALGLGEDAVTEWARETIDNGLEALAVLLGGGAGRFCFGDRPTLADVCLVPQLVNARRFGVDLRWPRIAKIEAACLGLDAFRDASPERQPDAE